MVAYVGIGADCRQCSPVMASALWAIWMRPMSALLLRLSASGLAGVPVVAGQLCSEQDRVHWSSAWSLLWVPPIWRGPWIPWMQAGQLGLGLRLARAGPILVLMNSQLTLLLGCIYGRTLVVKLWRSSGRYAGVHASATCYCGHAVLCCLLSKGSYFCHLGGLARRCMHMGRARCCVPTGRPASSCTDAAVSHGICVEPPSTARIRIPLLLGRGGRWHGGYF